jgi:glycosyltransferase involved in cell wall biosynthesis
VSARPDVLIVSLGTTRGLRVADAGFAELLRDAGASVSLAGTQIGLANRLRRGYPLNDVVEALAARRAIASALARERPRALVCSTTTTALLMGDVTVPYAIRFDAPAALNRPGLRNAPLHRLERRRMAGARVLLPTSGTARDALPAGAARAVVVPIPVLPSAPEPGDPRRGRVAVAYVPDPKAKGLDLLCAAWDRAALPDAELHVYGIEPALAQAFLARRGIAEPAGVRWQGMAASARFRRALRSARVYTSAARWEDYGQAQLEALADGALLVTAPSAGPFEALALARRLAPDLVADDGSPAALATCLTRAFALDDTQLADRRAAATAALTAYTPARATELLAREVLPALLS